MRKRRICVRLLSFLLVVVFVLFTPIVAQASATQVPWMTGDFESPFGFSLAIPNYDNPLASLDFSPVLGPITWTWNCDPFECLGGGAANVIGGQVGGLILFDGATFNGLVLGGSFQEAKIIDLTTGQPYLDTQTYNYDFFGFWSNGWSTVGNASADVELDARPVSGYQLTTYSPEPGTMLLTGIFIATACVRMKARVRFK